MLGIEPVEPARPSRGKSHPWRYCDRSPRRSGGTGFYQANVWAGMVGRFSVHDPDRSRPRHPTHADGQLVEGSRPAHEQPVPPPCQLAPGQPPPTLTACRDPSAGRIRRSRSGRTRHCGLAPGSQTQGALRGLDKLPPPESRDTLIGQPSNSLATSLRITLPSIDFGNSPTLTNRCGTLYAANRSLPHDRSARSSS